MEVIFPVSEELRAASSWCKEHSWVPGHSQTPAAGQGAPQSPAGGFWGLIVSLQPSTFFNLDVRFTTIFILFKGIKTPNQYLEVPEQLAERFPICSLRLKMTTPVGA